MLRLEDILLQEEGKTLEFKENLSSPSKIIRTVLAFANTAGGVKLEESIFLNIHKMR